MRDCDQRIRSKDAGYSVYIFASSQIDQTDVVPRYTREYGTSASIIQKTSNCYLDGMINDVAGLLNALRDKLAEEAGGEASITHPGIIGEMYEEAAARVLKSASAFKGLNLRVASGFVEDANGVMSKEVDCMICIGEGRRIGRTRRRIYPMDDVLMIVEVKKALRGRDLESSILWFRHFWTNLARNPASRMPNLVHKSWKLLTARPFPADENEIQSFTLFEQILFRRIVTEACLPARVVFAFDGYANEAELRRGVSSTMIKMGLLPQSAGIAADINAVPNLIVCGNSAVIKFDGMPYRGLFDEDEQYWGWLGSNSGNPMLPLLEILWTRLQTRFGLTSEIFGDDLLKETAYCFGVFETINHSGKTHFNFGFYPDPEIGETTQTNAEWHPAELSEVEFSVIHNLTLGHEADLDDPELRAYLAKTAVTEEKIVQSLRKKELAGVRGRKIVLLTEKLRCCILPDGRMVAADDSSGRLSAYLNRHIKPRWTDRKNDSSVSSLGKKPPQNPDG